LVVRTNQKNEVWRDETANLLWSDDSLFVTGDQPTLLAFCKDPDQGRDAKGNLDAAYRLPTADEFRAAESHGIRAVLRGMEELVFWTSTLFETTDAWFYEDGELDHMPLNSSDEYFRARCVAEEPGVTGK